jgi:hypothetical protein
VADRPECATITVIKTIENAPSASMTRPHCLGPGFVENVLVATNLTDKF